jgi:transposase
MQVVYHRCCGLDIHKKLIVACLLLMTSQGVHKEMRTFGTTLAELYRLRDWLTANDCQMVAMEATGCTGNRFGMCWKRSNGNCFWSTPST